MVEPVPVSDLVAAALDGDEGAWTALVERYGGLVVAIAHQHRLDPQETADVSQTVWLRVGTPFRNAAPSRPQPWSWPPAPTFRTPGGRSTSWPGPTRRLEGDEPGPLSGFVCFGGD
jgi:hypothetical protein